ncbi:hypothetical protein GCM10022217_24150 [Chryseobacterium ginsenosidimutans]
MKLQYTFHFIGLTVKILNTSTIYIISELIQQFYFFINKYYFFLWYVAFCSIFINKKYTYPEVLFPDLVAIKTEKLSKIY